MMPSWSWMAFGLVVTAVFAVGLYVIIVHYTDQPCPVVSGEDDVGKFQLYVQVQDSPYENFSMFPYRITLESEQQSKVIYQCTDGTSRDSYSEAEAADDYEHYVNLADPLDVGLRLNFLTNMSSEWGNQAFTRVKVEWMNPVKVEDRVILKENNVTEAILEPPLTVQTSRGYKCTLSLALPNSEDPSQDLKISASVEEVQLQ